MYFFMLLIQIERHYAKKIGVYESTSSRCMSSQSSFQYQPVHRQCTVSHGYVRNRWNFISLLVFSFMPLDQLIGAYCRSFCPSVFISDLSWYMLFYRHIFVIDWIQVGFMYSWNMLEYVKHVDRFAHAKISHLSVYWLRQNINDL